jgi:hypothetical protein
VCVGQLWKADQQDCVADLREHKKEIYAIRWSPTGPGTNNPDQKKTLARYGAREGEGGWGQGLEMWSHD